MTFEGGSASFDSVTLSAPLKPAGPQSSVLTIAWTSVRHVDIGLFYDYLVL